MLNLTDLEQFVAFADYGTLSKASEILHISQPTITRTMRHVEEAFAVSLFERGKNRIQLNATGEKAVEVARKLLTEAEDAVQLVQTFDRNLHTIHIETCAPAPLWSLLPVISSKCAGKAIASKIAKIEEIITDVQNGSCEIGILPFAYENENLTDEPYIEEKLSVCIPKDHALAQYDRLSTEQINGFNCLLRDKIGFWTDFCYKKMPASRFLIQTDEFELEELVRTSTLFCFTTNLSKDSKELLKNREIIPITDKEANVRYHLIYKKGKEAEGIHG